MKRIGALLLVLATACGKRGDPRPPVPVIPQAATDLVVTQRATRIVLSWSYPSLTTAGRSLTDVRRVVVHRYTEELPPPADAALVPPAEPGVPEPVARFAAIPLLAPAQFVRLSIKLDSIEGANLAGATVGSRLLFEDTPPLRSAAGRPVRHTYAVVTEATSARSEPSNLAAIVPLDVAVPPTQVAATAEAQGVVVQWSVPAAAATGAEAPVIVGYNVYRDIGEPAGEMPPPVNTSAVSDTTFTDVPPYGEHEYRVSAVAFAGPPRVESDPSAPARATFKDLVPPPPPRNFSALVETTQVRLIWEAVEAPDLAGYKIYRAEGVGQLEIGVRDVGKFPLFMKPITEMHYTDVGPAPGISYRYEIVSVDKSGNESEPASTGWVLVPKTP